MTQEWRAYVRDTPALAEAYGDYFEAEEEEEIAAEEKTQVSREPTRRVAAGRGQRHTAQPHRSVGR
ncbi:MAG TPA: hypothetical protein DIC52_22500 [Candidatus Latescibacteria bacterium]|nr:hypothetical protein [Candidatus Latescibacterota bacterium]